MKLFAKLIHKSYMTFLPTHYPVHFYGLPDGKVYLFYARLQEKKGPGTHMEFVFAVHNDFSFNYDKGLLIPKAVFRAPVYNEMVDNPDPDISILEICEEVSSYTQAINYINDLGQNIQSQKNGFNTSITVGNEVQLGV